MMPMETVSLSTANTSAPLPGEQNGGLRRERGRQLRLWGAAVVRGLGARLGDDVFRALPQEPGVYFFYDAAGTLLYIGQSCDLRARVGSYRHVSPERHPRRTLRLVGRIAKIEWRVCVTPEEAIETERVLLLEHRPPFNRAGVWPGSPWWMSARAVDDSVVVRLLREPDLEDAACVGPLPGGFRYVHASLMRCVMRLWQPLLPAAGYPHGMWNITAPVMLRLPVAAVLAVASMDANGDMQMELGADPEKLAKDMAEDLRRYARGDGAAWLARLEALHMGDSLMEQEYWAAEVEGLRRYAAKMRDAEAAAVMKRVNVRTWEKLNSKGDDEAIPGEARQVELIPIRVSVPLPLFPGMS